MVLYLVKNEFNSFFFMDFKGVEIGKKLVLFYFFDGRFVYYEVFFFKDGKVVGVMFIFVLKIMFFGWM